MQTDAANAEEFRRQGYTRIAGFLPPAANAEEFRRQGYTRIAGFLPPAVVRVVVEECWILQRNGFFKRNDSQVPGAPSGYAPLPIEALMNLATPFMEKIAGRQLWPTYSYMRIYHADLRAG